MRNAFPLRSAVDKELIEDLLVALRKRPEEEFMVKEVAQAMGVSLATAGKYIDVCAAMDLVHVRNFATAKLVKLTQKGRTWVAPSTPASGH